MAIPVPEMRIIRKKGKYPDPITVLYSRLRVGFPKSKSSRSNILKAAYNEFGTGHIPERPFMRTAMRVNRAKYLRTMKKDAQVILAKGGDGLLRASLDRLGAMAQGDIQHSITSGHWTPNAPSTIRAKGSSRPLIDTGEMRNSVTWAID